MYYVYLLQSQEKPQSFYIGSTNNPQRRLAQHNGDLAAGGAFRTKREGYRPWKMVMLCVGFHSKIAALQFEHAWQHSHLTRHIEDKLSHSNSIHIKLANLKKLLGSEGFRRWNISVYILDRSIYKSWCLNRYGVQTPEYLRMDVLEVELSEFMKVIEEKDEKLVGSKKNTEEGEEDKDEERSLNQSCSLCSNDITTEDFQAQFCTCYHCQTQFHVICLARSFTSDLLPVKGSCSRCNKILYWLDLMRSVR
ncbi:BA75_01608T0 [Komagataella pastoris]|uniref:BA75_01608T0 n=1 Tax=Komagataella pastoris TaxID=4922 RepID=A0A1B2J8L5_PICPA|nr:BA75_01608T0 [Komagataella pastoris]